jgi:hypothetical protein
MLLLIRELCIVKRKLAGEHTDNKGIAKKRFMIEGFLIFSGYSVISAINKKQLSPNRNSDG